MITGIVEWWKGQSTIIKVITGLFVGLVLLVLVVGSVLFRRRITESSVVDKSVDVYDAQSQRRLDELYRQDDEGKMAIDEADKAIERLQSDGGAAVEERMKRKHEILDADNWSDLDCELGSTRDRSRTKSK